LKRNDGRDRPAPAREIAAVLHEQRLVEAVGRVEIGADRRRQRLFLVEGPPGREPDDEERQRDQHEQCRNESDDAPQRVASISMPASNTSTTPVTLATMETINPGEFSSQSNASSTTTCASA
jgi:hypothetical protein